jgi:hypothetical protein
MVPNASTPRHYLDFLKNAADRATDPLEKSYLIDRVWDQIEWYDRKSGLYQRRYNRLKMLVILLSALIPFLVGYADSKIMILAGAGGTDGITLGNFIQIAVGLIGVTVAVAEGISVFRKFRDLWLGYRSTAERLKRETWLYLTQGAEYAESASAFATFVDNMEAIMASENSQWITIVEREEKERKDGDGRPAKPSGPAPAPATINGANTEETSR